MGFATAALLLAVVNGATGAWAGHRRGPLGRATATAVAVTVALTAVEALAWRLLADWFGFFALAHLVYFLLTVSVPVIGAGLLVARRADLRTAAWPALGLAALLLPAPVGLWASHVEPHRLRTDRAVLDVDGLAAPIRIGVLADVQNDHIGDYEQRALQRLVDENVDILLVPGDLWQMSNRAIEQRWPEIAAYLAEMGASVEHVVVVEGDTDDLGWLRHMTGGGATVHLLADETLRLTVHGVDVRIAGTTLRRDLGITRAGFDAINALGDAPPDALTIVVSHRPDVVFDLRHPVDLVVSGHTHGGQIALPWFGPLVTFSDVPRSVAAGGLHRVGGQPVYVSTGVGLERHDAPQVRFLVRPSVGVIDLLPAPTP